MFYRRKEGGTMTHRVYYQHFLDPVRLNEVAKRTTFKSLALALLILSGEGQAQTLREPGPAGWKGRTSGAALN